MANIAELLAETSRTEDWSHRRAFLVGDRQYTHENVHDGASRFAGLLKSRGVAPGDRVMIVLPDSVELIWAFLGTIRRGCVAVLINPMINDVDHRAMVADCDPSLVVCAERHADRFAAQSVLFADGLERELAGHESAPAEAIGPRDPAFALYTSGTTGNPKAVLHSSAGPANFRRSFLAEVTHLGSDELIYCVNKMCYAYGLCASLFTPLLTGGAAVLTPNPPQATEIADLLTKHDIDVFCAVPGLYAKLLFGDHAAALAGIRLAITAGEPLPRSVEELYGKSTTAPMLNHLGSTEVGQPFVSSTLEAARQGTVGRVLPGFQLRLVDEDGDEVPRGEVGAIQVSGEPTTLGYLSRPAETEALYDGDWMRTNDLGFLDADGYLHLLGRKDHVEICAGMNVYPFEIEETLLRHPAVIEAAVCSVTSGTAVNELWAFVALRGAEPSADLETELTMLVRGQHAEFKVPRRVVFLPGLPRNPNGKVNRAALRTGDPT